MKALFTYLILALFLTSCELARPLVVQPSGTGSYYDEQGTLLFSQELDSIRTWVSFAGADNTNLWFDITYHNTRADTVVVDPLGSYLVAVDAYNNRFTLPVRSANELITETEENLRMLDKKQERADVAQLLLGVVTIAADVAVATSSKNVGSKLLVRDGLVAAQGVNAASSVYRDSRYQRLLEELDFRRSWLMSRTTLGPDQSVSGRIMFRRNEGPVYVLFLPVAASDTLRVRFDRIRK